MVENILMFAKQGRESLESNLSGLVKRVGKDFTVIKSNSNEIYLYWTEEGNYNGWNIIF